MPWGFPSSEHRRLQVWRSEWQWLCLVRGLNHPVEDPVSGLRSNLLVVSKGVGGDWLLKLTSYLLPLPSLCRSWVDSTFSSPIACPKRLPSKRDSCVVRNPAWEPETLTPRERETEVWSGGGRAPLPPQPFLLTPWGTTSPGLGVSSSWRERVGCQGCPPEVGERFPVNSLT